MKKLILSALVAATVVNTAYVPRSQAIVGILAGSPAVMAASVITVLGVGGIGMTGLVFDILFNRGGPGISDYILAPSAMAVGIGFILLDNETQTLAYQPVNEAQARLMGISRNEMTAYNSELDLINILADDTTHQIKNLQQRDIQSNEDKKQIAADLQAHYELVSADLGISAEAKNALAKVSAHSVKAK